MPGVTQAQDTLVQTMYRCAPLTVQWFQRFQRIAEPQRGHLTVIMILLDYNSVILCHFVLSYNSVKVIM
jgi:hypothetical protein